MARGAGSPAATGRTPGGMGNSGLTSHSRRGRAGRGRSLVAGASSRRAARAGRYRPLPRGAAAAAGGAGGGLRGAERPREAGASGAGCGGGRGRKRETLPGARRDHSGLDSSREDTTSWLPERPPLAGSALPPPPAVRATRLRLSLRRFPATSALLCPPPRPPASRLHDNSAPTPRPAPPPRRRDSKGSRLTSSGGGVNGGQRPIRGEGREGKRREVRKGLEHIGWRGGA